MKLGLGLYRHMLTEDNLRFARQAGATHIVAHLVDYFRAGPRIPSSVSAIWLGVFDERVGKPWTLAEIEGVKRGRRRRPDTPRDREPRSGPLVRRAAARSPARRAARAGARDHPAARPGGRPVPGLQLLRRRRVGPPDRSVRARRSGVDRLRRGRDSERSPRSPSGRSGTWTSTRAVDGTIGAVDGDQVWARLRGVPRRRRAGRRGRGGPAVRTPRRPAGADPARHRPRADQPRRLQRLVDPSPAAQQPRVLPGHGLRDARRRRLRRDRAFRARRTASATSISATSSAASPNTTRCSSTRATSTCSGAADLRGNGYDGVFIPDHTPQMTCAAPWHAGMAYALGYMRAAMEAAERS